MTPTETVKLLARAVACYPAMTIQPGQPEVWHELLGDLDYDDAVVSLMGHARAETRIITPADIRRGAVDAHRHRKAATVRALPAAQAPVGPPPPGWVTSVRQMLTGRREAS